ncbi:hypothetical protein E2542_SST05316 [Spatholobus suberectus]|nr:hypothetical protein E2542_SST05316 [Spatholobus suberectus]
MKGSSKRKTEKEKREDEVEELLQVAQDQILLNLSHSHMARASPFSPSAKKDVGDTELGLDLDLDLERRFQALKMKTKSASPPQPQDDLSARFDALKAKSSPSVDPTVTASNSTARFDNYNEEEEESEDEEAQVQKLIQWAKDAARLDPSPPSDDDSDI